MIQKPFWSLTIFGELALTMFGAYTVSGVWSSLGNNNPNSKRQSNSSPMDETFCTLFVLGVAVLATRPAAIFYPVPAEGQHFDLSEKYRHILQ
jgi:hypothetical protein